MLSFQLPWPPSVNRYWRHIVMGRSARVLISSEGREYRQKVFLQLRGIYRQPPLQTRLAVSIAVYPPDRRARDLDNLLKALLDSLQHGGIYESDSQIDQLAVLRKHVVADGRVVVDIEELTVAERSPVQEALIA